MTNEQMEKLEKLAGLHAQGILSDEEFNTQKATLLQSESTPKPTIQNRQPGTRNYDAFLQAHVNYFDPAKMSEIKEKLEHADDKKLEKLRVLDLKNPTTMFWIALFLGPFGGDRFMLNQTALGFLKLLCTAVTFGIWWLGDLFTIKKRTWKYNYNILMNNIA